MAKKDSRTRTLPDGSTQYDYVEPGGDEHMRLLGLKKASKDDKPQYKGYALDGEPYGVLGWTVERKEALLKQKVSSLTTLPPEIQSETRDAPGYAPEMWMPHEPGEEVQGII